MAAHALLNDEEVQCLQRHLTLNQQTNWQYRVGWVLVALIPILFVVIGQMEIRGLPAYLEARGLTVCQSHRTLHRGTVWWPAEPGFKDLCRASGAVLVLSACYTGISVGGMFVQERRARRIALINARTHLDLLSAECKAP